MQKVVRLAELEYDERRVSGNGDLENTDGSIEVKETEDNSDSKCEEDDTFDDAIPLQFTQISLFSTHVAVDSEGYREKHLLCYSPVSKGSAS